MNFAILFSGQGLQTQQHIDELRTYASDDDIRKVLEQYLPEIFQEDIQTLNMYDNQFAQPFIFALQWCRWQNIRTVIDEVGMSAGYSLGELSALICSTQTDLATGLVLAKKRAQFMSEAMIQHSGLMAVKGLNIESLKKILLNTQTELSIKLNDSSFIVGGKLTHLQELKRSAEQLGAQIQPLNVSIPSHTSFMHHAVDPYSRVLNQTTFKPLTIPVISGTKGMKLYDYTKVVETLIYQMEHSIDWDLCLESLKENMPDIVLEIGPGNALSKMLLEIKPNFIVRAVDDFKCIENLKIWLKELQH